MHIIECNTHAQSFEKGGKPGKYDRVDMLLPALNLVGVFTFHYSYPLNCPAEFEHTLTADMNGEDILMLAKSDYERIYSEEDAAVGDPGNIPGMLNRATSAGPYGIWGHSFSDLYFEAVLIDLADKKIKLGMGS